VNSWPFCGTNQVRAPLLSIGVNLLSFKGKFGVKILLPWNQRQHSIQACSLVSWSTTTLEGHIEAWMSSVHPPDYRNVTLRLELSFSCSSFAKAKNRSCNWRFHCNQLPARGSIERRCSTSSVDPFVDRGTGSWPVFQIQCTMTPNPRGSDRTIAN
jgi:hypothetical protein